MSSIHTTVQARFIRFADVAKAASFLLIAGVLAAVAAQSSSFPVATQGVAMSMSFDGANYLIGVENHQTPSPTLAAQRVSADGQFIGRDGSLIGGKLSLSTDPGNQLGGASFANGRYLVLVNNGVNMGEGGISQVDSATGTFVDPLPLLQVLTSDSAFGVRPNGFGFTISGTSGQTFVVEACANLVASDWSPLQTNTIVDGSSTFSDSAWTNYPGRFYRLRSP